MLKYSIVAAAVVLGTATCALRANADVVSTVDSTITPTQSTYNASEEIETTSIPNLIADASAPETYYLTPGGGYRGGRFMIGGMPRMGGMPMGGGYGGGMPRMGGMPMGGGYGGG
ncbi:MAG TPA: hypothetical protein V6C65_28160, partial [Allocoleopsis sp.]